MALSKQDIRDLEKALGATHRGTVPATGGGAFGAARLAAILSKRLVPSQGKGTGRPSNPNWDTRKKVPMSTTTATELEQLALLFSDESRKMTAMQLAGQVLEEGLQQLKASVGSGK